MTLYKLTVFEDRGTTTTQVSRYAGSNQWQIIAGPAQRTSAPVAEKIVDGSTTIAAVAQFMAGVEHTLQEARTIEVTAL